MAVSYMDFTSPNTQFFYDVSKNRAFTKNSENYINSLGIQQLNTLGNVSLLDIFMTKGNVVEPHIHQNASELVYCISGSATVSILNPFTKKVIDVHLTPWQVANVPQGWFHWDIAAEDTHFLAIFDAPVPEFIAVSDLLRLAPPSLLAHTYCLDEAMLKEVLAPITSTTTIGPPADCDKSPANLQPQTYTQAAAAAKPAMNSNYPPYAHPYNQPYVQPYGQSYAQPHSQAYASQAYAHNQAYAQPYAQPYGGAAQQPNPYQPRPFIGNGYGYTSG